MVQGPLVLTPPPLPVLADAATFPLIVLRLIVSVPGLLMPPPRPPCTPLAVFPVMVLSITLRLPPIALKIPPPEALALSVPPLIALPMTAQFVSVRFPEFEIPAPKPVSSLPLLIVSRSSVTCAPAETSKSRKLNVPGVLLRARVAPLPLILSV